MHAINIIYKDCRIQLFLYNISFLKNSVYMQHMVYAGADMFQVGGRLDLPSEKLLLKIERR